LRMAPDLQPVARPLGYGTRWRDRRVSDEGTAVAGAHGDRAHLRTTVAALFENGCVAPPTLQELDQIVLVGKGLGLAPSARSAQSLGRSDGFLLPLGDNTEEVAVSHDAHRRARVALMIEGG